MSFQQTPTQVLQQYFGYSDFREGQLEIITSVLKKRNTLALLPTGGGKSICFQIPGIMLSGMTVVISPLLSLIKDQVEALQAKNIPALALTSEVSKAEKQSLLDAIKKNPFYFIYASPEMLETGWWQKHISVQDISLVVIDEAHCISEWGHDFRPSYRRIVRSLQLEQHKTPLSAFTATATSKTIAEITSNLGISEQNVFRHNRIPAHIFVSVDRLRSTSQKLIKLCKILNRHAGQSGIIYALTRNETEQIAAQIARFDFHHRWGRVHYYHGGMEQKERAAIQEQFLENKINIIVATNAFGMGVDKPDIRFVVHVDLPNSIEAFVQEIGRAGRDRNPAKSYLLFNPTNLKVNLAMATSKHKMDTLKKALSFARKRSCYKYHLSRYFDIDQDLRKCGSCSNCVLRTSTPKTIVKIDPLLSTKVQQELIYELQPFTAKHYLQIPGLGKGWLKKYYPDIKNGKIQLYEK